MDLFLKLWSSWILLSQKPPDVDLVSPHVVSTHGRDERNVKGALHNSLLSWWQHQSIHEDSVLMTQPPPKGRPSNINTCFLEDSVKRPWRDDLGAKGTSGQGPEFNPQNHVNLEGEKCAHSYTLTSTCLWHVCLVTHKHTHTHVLLYFYKQRHIGRKTHEQEEKTWLVDQGPRWMHWLRQQEKMQFLIF